MEDTAERISRVLLLRPVAFGLGLLSLALFVTSILWSGQWAGEVADESFMLGLMLFTFLLTGLRFRWIWPAYLVILPVYAVQLGYAVAGVDPPKFLAVLPLAAVALAFVGWRRERRRH